MVSLSCVWQVFVTGKFGTLYFGLPGVILGVGKVDNNKTSASGVWHACTERKAQAVSPVGSPEEWARTRHTILRALAPFPDAKEAVYAALTRNPREKHR